MTLLVTTSARPSARQRERAARIAARCGAPLVPRRGGLAALMARHEVPLAYVVARDREKLTDGRQHLSVELGLLHARCAAGASHPLIRALGPVARVLDGTLGLALDALHVASVTGAQVLGIEASAPLACLCEEGLQRLAREGLAAAERVTVHHGLAQQLLGQLGPADAVLLSPMFDAPAAASPGWDLLRPLALHAPLDEVWLHAALDAAPRVVVKARRGQPMPDAVVAAGAHLIRARAVDYWVMGGPT